MPFHSPRGVAFESGSGRFNIEEKRGGRDQRGCRFAKTVAGAIKAKATHGDFQRLCLIAPARTLAAVRREPTPEASATIAPVLSKDLTKTPDHRLGDWLQDLEFN